MPANRASIPWPFPVCVWILKVLPVCRPLSGAPASASCHVCRGTHLLPRLRAPGDQSQGLRLHTPVPSVQSIILWSRLSSSSSSF